MLNRAKTIKSLLVTQSFATNNNHTCYNNYNNKSCYKNSERIRQRFECTRANTTQTVLIRLDQELGFETERGWDYLTVQWEGYYSRISGPIQYLPYELKQADWYDTESNYLEMGFSSDGSVNMKGFKFDILCQDSSETNQLSATQSKCYRSMSTNQPMCDTDKNVVITNDEKIEGYFAKGVSCLTPSEHIQYRLTV